MKPSTLLKGTAALISFIALSLPVQAGAKYTEKMGLNSSWIWGSLSDTRSSNHDKQLIKITDESTHVEVYAINSSGQKANCVTRDPAMMAALRNAKTDSYIKVRQNSRSECIGARVVNSSGIAPKR